VNTHPPREDDRAAQSIRWREQPRPDDRETVRSIVQSTGFFSAGEIEIAVELVDEFLRRGRDSGYAFLFAEDQARVLGYACFGPIPCTTHSFDLYWIAVARSHQGRGRGRAIMEEVEARVRQAGGRRLYIDTSGRTQYAPSRAFYEHCGYERAATLPDFYAPGDEKVIYVKSLP
jgi:GNAT superfamily N-acetyltransferase